MGVGQNGVERDIMVTGGLQGRMDAVAMVHNRSYPPFLQLPCPLSQLRPVLAKSLVQAKETHSGGDVFKSPFPAELVTEHSFLAWQQDVCRIGL